LLLLIAVPVKITLSIIASRTGVSVSTVSRVLSGRATDCRIPAETVEKVLAEARKSGYLPNMVARNVKNNLVGLLLPTVSNPFFSEMASKIIAQLRGIGYFAIVMEHNEDAEIFRECASTLLPMGVDGIVAVPSTISDDEALLMESIDRKFCPVVLIDRTYPNTKLPLVSTNNFQGGLMATRKLLNFGHSNIVCIQGSVNSTPNIDRVNGYKTAMTEAGFSDFISVFGDDFSIRNGYLQTKRIIVMQDRPTAIFALGNTIALGAIEAVKEAGLSVGKDISIISFDNNANLGHVGPDIAAISQPVEDMTQVAVRLLRSKLDGINVESSQVLLAPSYIAGDTLCRLK